MENVYTEDHEWYLMVGKEPSDLDVRFKIQEDGSVYCLDCDKMFSTLESLREYINRTV